MLTNNYKVGDLIRFHEDTYAMTEDPSTGSMIDCVLGSNSNIIGIITKILQTDVWNEVEILSDGEILIIPDPSRLPDLILVGN